MTGFRLKFCFYSFSLRSSFFHFEKRLFLRNNSMKKYMNLLAEFDEVRPSREYRKCWLKKWGYRRFFLKLLKTPAIRSLEALRRKFAFIFRCEFRKSILKLTNFPKKSSIERSNPAQHLDLSLSLVNGSTRPFTTRRPKNTRKSIQIHLPKWLSSLHSHRNTPSHQP